ncbi:uncharacterized protein LOC103311881 [Acyrthosiphon pisum]|uniref:DDE Tnp4 domain-containing protein n=1 Tax=Acyrthosiphon pisum TaxID=7029 RepID=A0A8R2FDV4_ACYPI|nr:uncharacterized protein LOC103311881 [Acyrthosiphon pisum]|eukprot:XP_008189913.1 PREDICTED: uncharacterized protein LOC103311881 [Acyrthosiphon pisum]
MEDVTSLVFQHLIEEEERDEQIISLLFLKNSKRQKVHDMFISRREEGAFQNIISKHLIDDETKFHNYFRLTKYQFNFVLSAITKDVFKAPTTTVKFPITPKEKLAVTLRYLATGESYRSLAFNFRISHCEISNIVKEVLAICKNLMPVLLPPPTENDFKTRASEFWERLNFPNCVGAIDGKHVRVMCPDQTGSLYFNYKNYFSLVLLAIVDAKYKFLAIDVGSYGKEGDSGIFSKSVMGQRIYTEKFGLPSEDIQLPGSEKCLPYVIIGDEAFMLHKRIMKPFNRAQAKADYEKSVFNYPTCCLHNLIRDGYEGTNTQIVHQELTNMQTTMQPLARFGGYGNVEGFEVRDAFKCFFSGEGKVNWQNHVVSRT